MVEYAMEINAKKTIEKTMIESINIIAPNFSLIVPNGHGKVITYQKSPKIKVLS